MGTTSNRPGTGAARANPETITSSGTPSAAAVVAAARAFRTWNEPASASSTRWPRHVNVVSARRAVDRRCTSVIEYATLGTRLALQESPAPEVVAVDHRQRGAFGREQRRLGREVRLDRPVVVEMVVGQVGEHRRVEADAVDARLGQRVGRHLHGHGPPRLASRASARIRCKSGDSGVVRAPSRVPMTVVGHRAPRRSTPAGG